MPDIESFSPRGMFHKGWTAEVNDYAIVCGWATKGKLFIVGDVAGGIFAFEGDTGKIIWKKENTHSSSSLSLPLLLLLSSLSFSSVFFGFSRLVFLDFEDFFFFMLAPPPTLTSASTGKYKGVNKSYASNAFAG